MDSEDTNIDPPLIAILRGISPGEASEIGDALIAGGIKVLEVTMNSPEPLESITTLAEQHGENSLVGAGTVLSAEEVDQVKEAGGNLIVSPHLNPQIVRRTKELGMVSAPGCMTPTELFAALSLGADMIKLFPGEIVTPAAVKALGAVAPQGTKLVVTGGVSLQNIADYKAAGVYGLGLGSALYKPGKPVQQVQSDAESFVAAFNS